LIGEPSLAELENLLNYSENWIPEEWVENVLENGIYNQNL
jgi:hypothetical protein